MAATFHRGEKLEDQAFYHGNIRREDARDFLVQPGDFLVRSVLKEGALHYGVIVKYNEDADSAQSVTVKQLIEKSQKREDTEIKQLKAEKLDDWEKRVREKEELGKKERALLLLPEWIVISEKKGKKTKYRFGEKNDYPSLVELFEETFRMKEPLPLHYCDKDDMCDYKGAILLRAISRPTWERKREMVQYKMTSSALLGRGNFGVVVKGKLMETGKEDVEVAIKVSLPNTEKNRRKIDRMMAKKLGDQEKYQKAKDYYYKEKEKNEAEEKDLNNEADMDPQTIDLMKEAKAMRFIEHPNLLKTFGIVVDAAPCLLVLEYMNSGSLISHVLKQSEDENWDKDNKEKAWLLLQAAWGVDYLHYSVIIHRDIAARNCLLHKSPDSERLILKISDFGMSRGGSQYALHRNIPLPIRWMAPESLKSKIFNSASDVWSFGCLTEELYGKGNKPFKKYEENEVQRKLQEITQDVIKEDFISSDYPKHAKTIIEMCWVVEEANRCKMKHVSKILEGYLGEAPPLNLYSDDKKKIKPKKTGTARDKEGSNVKGASRETVDDKPVAGTQSDTNGSGHGKKTKGEEDPPKKKKTKRSIKKK